MDTEGKSIVATLSEHFSKEVLEAQDGKKVPLTAEPGGPVIGEVTLKYDPGSGNLEGYFRVDDPKFAKFLQRDLSFNPVISEES